MCLAVPYYDVYDKKTLEKLMPAVKMFKTVSPNKTIKMPETKKKHLFEFSAHEMNLGRNVTPHNIL